MPTALGLFGPQAMLATDLLSVQHSPGSQIVSAKARLATHRESLRVMLVPVLRQRDGSGQLLPAAGWIPVSSWKTQWQAGGPSTIDPPSELESVVHFDFAPVPAAEGAAVMFLVSAPKPVQNFQLKMSTSGAVPGLQPVAPTPEELLEALRKALENLIFRAVLQRPS